jgi:hypothetical protein
MATPSTICIASRLSRVDMTRPNEEITDAAGPW